MKPAPKSVHNTGREALRGNDFGQQSVQMQFLQHDADCQAYLRQLLGAWLVEVLALGDAVGDAADAAVEKLVEQLLTRLQQVPLPRKLRFVAHLVREEAAALQMEGSSRLARCWCSDSSILPSLCRSSTAFRRTHPLPATAQQGEMALVITMISLPPLQTDVLPNLFSSSPMGNVMLRQQLLQKFLTLLWLMTLQTEILLM